MHIGSTNDFSKTELTDLVETLSELKLYVLFGWNGEAKDGVDQSHYLALRYGMLLSDLAAGAHNDPAKRNLKPLSVSNLRALFYGKDTCLRVYEVSEVLKITYIV